MIMNMFCLLFKIKDLIEIGHSLLFNVKNTLNFFFKKNCI